MKKNDIKKETRVGRMKFSTVCKEWLRVKQNSVKESTYLNYKYKITKSIIPDLGNKTLSELSNFDINKYIKTKKKENRGVGIRDTIVILKSVLKYAKKKYKIDFDLDFDAKVKGAEKTPEIEVFSDKEKQKLTKFLLKTKRNKELGILLSLYAGLRIGEVCGLKWEDIDFENKIINVNRTVQRVYLGPNQTKVIVTVPKTRRSLRKIPISKVIYDVLYKFSQQYPPNTYVLTGKENKCTEPLIYRYLYRNVLKWSEVPYRKYHCLRHTFATRCIRVGMDVKSLSEVLGHSNIGITLATYVHSSYEVKKRYIDRV